MKKQLIENYNNIDGYISTYAKTKTGHVKLILSKSKWPQHNTVEALKLCSPKLLDALIYAAEQSGIAEITVSYITDQGKISGHWNGKTCQAIDITELLTSVGQIIPVYRNPENMYPLVETSRFNLFMENFIKGAGGFENAEIYSPWHMLSFTVPSYPDGWSNLLNDFPYLAKSAHDSDRLQIEIDKIGIYEGYIVKLSDFNFCWRHRHHGHFRVIK